MALWDKIGSRGNVEDHRGSRSTLALSGGITGLIITAAVLLLSSQSGSQVLETILGQALQTTTTQQEPFTDSTDYKGFTEKVLGSTNEYWTGVYSARGQTYTPPTLVLFREATQTGCGTGTSQVGPFYCPADQTIYLDETFFDGIQQQLNADTGDVAQAYVIAHEVGHHVQSLQGTLNQQSDPIKLELQADCYAGTWSNSISGIFENEDEINEALGLASAIGDDRIQEKTQGQVNPETWTHGSSEQRVQWFKTGFASGDPTVCTP
ncbi:MAG: neutral zinc metallopeptidase [Candidatus Saccharimonadales bacterium]